MVGVLKKRLAIPRHAPQVLRTLITACWQDDADLRPAFSAVFPMIQVWLLWLCSVHVDDTCVLRNDSTQPDATSAMLPMRCMQGYNLGYFMPNTA